MSDLQVPNLKYTIKLERCLRTLSLYAVRLKRHFLVGIFLDVE